MTLWTVLLMGTTALTRNRMRSALTVLGIIIGVAAVIATLAIGQGARAAVQSQIAALGANTLTVIPGSVTSGGARGGFGGVQTMTADDATAIARDCPAVEAVSPGTRSTAQVVAGDNNWSTSIQGCTPDFITIRQWPVDEGAFFTDSDVRGSAKVAVLGQSVVDQLFPGQNPVGETVRIKNTPFKVVGVLAVKGGSGFGCDTDDTILIPYTTAQNRLMGITYVNWISVSARDQSSVNEATDEITELLRERHKIHGGNDDFFIRTQQEAASSAEATSQVMTTLLASIAAVSLLVGGIGIMNIMLVSVTERTREIGIRRAIGARRDDILLQFLIESAFLSLAGGALGVLIGVVAAKLVSIFARWPTLIQPQAVLVAFVFATMVGLFFGWYPAMRASKLNVVESLRYE